MKSSLLKIVLVLAACWNFAACSDDKVIENNDFVGTDNSIHSLEISHEGITYKAAIIGTEIILRTPQDVSLVGATAEMGYSENAKVSPDPSTVTTWNEDHMFTVTSYNKVEKTYIYKHETSEIGTTGNVTLSSQEDVNAFAKMNISSVDGNLIIGKETALDDTDVITDISGLSSLKTVAHNIVINPTCQVLSFEGLKNVEKIGGLRVGDIQHSKYLHLNKLKTIGTGLHISSTKLEEVSFVSLTYIGENFNVSGDLLSKIEFAELKTVEGDFILNGSTSYSSQNKTDVIAIPSLEKVGGKLEVGKWNELYQLSIPKLAHVGQVEMISLPKLEKLDFPDLKSTTKGIRVLANPSLTTVHFPQLKETVGIHIENNKAITSLDFGALTTVKGDLTINAVQIKDLKCFKSLVQVEKKFELQALNEVTTLSDMAALKEVGEYKLYNLAAIDKVDVKGLKTDRLSLMGTVMLKPIIGDDVFEGIIELNGASNRDVKSLPNFTGFRVVGGLEMSSIGDLEEVRLEKLEEVTGLLGINSGSNAIKVSFPALHSTGSLKITYMNKMEEVDFPALKTIKGSMEYEVSSNIQKFELTALEEVGETFKITISRNPLNNINMPKLKKIGKTFTLVANNWGRNTSLTNLDGFTTLESVGAVNIEYYDALESFAGLKNAISSLDAANWKVANCAYNPTLDDMKAGKWNK